MGADWYSHALIGVKIPSPFVEEMEPICDHPMTADQKFCSECGEGWQDVQTPFDGFDEDLEHCGDFHVVTGKDSMESEYYVGTFVSNGEYDSKESEMATLPDTIDVASIKQKLKVLLEPRGLWDESKFGLWSVLYVSC